MPGRGESEKFRGTEAGERGTVVSCAFTWLDANPEQLVCQPVPSPICLLLSLQITCTTVWLLFFRDNRLNKPFLQPANVFKYIWNLQTSASFQVSQPPAALAPVISTVTPVFVIYMPLLSEPLCPGGKVQLSFLAPAQSRLLFFKGDRLEED